MPIAHQPVVHPPPASTLLVVEDDPVLHDALCAVLQSQGYAVTRAANVYEALDILFSNPPDLVVSDVVMPKMDGHALLHRIRGNPLTRHTPVIFLTAHDSAEHRSRAKDWGVTDYLTKPFDQADLLQSVRVALRRHQEQEMELQGRVEEVRSQILALVQHEFRTPLTFIMGYAEFLHDALENGLPQHELIEAVTAILEGSHRMQHLVESFLLLTNLSRAEMPRDEIYPLDPAALWRECLTEAREQIRAASLVIHVDEPPDPIIVFGALDLLRAALSRLLDNAIRYRRPDAANIWLTTLAKPGYVGWLIRDEGVGIPQARLAQLTAPFVRAQPMHTPGHGIGLGLTLVRRVAELHGGYLEVESEEGAGSAFTLWISDREM